MDVQQARTIFRGPMISVATPLTPDFELDLDALRSNVRFMIDRGVRQGQGVLLVAEAGVGKSRITRALLDALADEPHTRIRYQCSPYHTGNALWPVIQHLSRAAGIATDDPIDARLDKLEALLALARDGADAAPLIASLIGLDGDQFYFIK